MEINGFNFQSSSLHAHVIEQSARVPAHQSAIMSCNKVRCPNTHLTWEHGIRSSQPPETAATTVAAHHCASSGRKAGTVPPAEGQRGMDESPSGHRRRHNSPRCTTLNTDFLSSDGAVSPASQHMLKLSRGENCHSKRHPEKCHFSNKIHMFT